MKAGARGLAALGAAVAGLALSASSAATAEVIPTAQAVAANAAWLAYAPPPPQPVAVCLVDTGVDLNADTAGPVITRDSLDGGTLDDVDASVHHGTRMAMMMAAPANGVGMVGVWPALKIVSVRAAATRSGQTTVFELDDYRRAITKCWADAPAAAHPVAVELALSGAAPATEQQRDDFHNELVVAHTNSLSVVAAAGNDGGPVGTPASTAGVFAVGAADRDGALCAFSARGSALALLAPGCDLDVSSPVDLTPDEPDRGRGGTSEASAVAATVLAALRAYAPHLSWSEAEGLLRDTASQGILNAAAAFRAADLGEVVNNGMAAMPPSTFVSSTTTTVTGLENDRPATSERARWLSPRLKTAHYSHGLLTVIVTARPRGGTLVVAALAPVHGRLRTVKLAARRASKVRMRLPRRPTMVRVVYVDHTDARRSPSMSTVKLVT